MIEIFIQSALEGVEQKNQAKGERRKAKKERRKAKEKALAMVEYIGYPKELREMEKLKELYSGLELNANSYVGNGLNLLLGSRLRPGDCS